MSVIKYLAGIYYGHTTAVRYKGSNQWGKAIWQCLCDCGQIHDAIGSNLQSGRTTSCGCYRKTHLITHDKTNTKAHKCWENMKNRCTNKNYKGYKYWGGRGITYCDRWEKFENFYEDMCTSRGLEDVPEGLSLDRIDNNLGYFNENCRWATPKEQRCNR